MSYEVLHTSELEVVIGDNQAGDSNHPCHCAGYNGIWSLTSIHEPRNCFVPRYCGLNLEHLMDGLFATTEEGDGFEPRHQPMQVKRISKAELARRLAWHGPQVDRLLDIRHASRLEHIDAAMAAMECRLHVSTE